MKLCHVALVFLGIVTFASSAHAAIYGGDERKNVSEEKNPTWIKAARSVAVMMHAKKVSISGSCATIKTTDKNRLKQAYNLCSDERYLEEPTHGLCTGFLIGPDLMMTARHCIPSVVSCSNFVWIFDYNDKSLDEEGNVRVKSSDVFECSEIVKHSTSRGLKHDFAIFKLNRKATGRTPLKLEDHYENQAGDPIGMVGAPLGLPLKISRYGEILGEDDELSFQVNVDTYGGNSGSPVFDVKTMKVLGILVAGEPDFTYNTAQKCSQSRHYYSERWKGERAYRVDVIDFNSFDGYTQ